MTALSQALSTAGWPGRLLTLADWEGLPDELSRSELSEGVLVVVPPPHPRHQNAVGVLELALRRDLPARLHPTHECGVVLEDDPPTARIPDVLVVPHAVYAAGPSVFAGTDVILAVEVMSPGSRRTDRVTKASEYADAGIGHYWFIDLDAGSLTELSLAPGGYEVRGVHRGQVELEVDGELVALDLDLLV